MTPKEIVDKLGYPLPDGWANDPEQAAAIKAVWPQIVAHNEKVIADALAATEQRFLRAIELAAKHIRTTKAAFGAPGDWGYNDPKGQALYELYVFHASVLVALLRESTCDATESQPERVE